MKTNVNTLVAALCLVATLAIPGTAQTGSRIIVDGTLWLQSSTEVRKAFLVGAGNMLALESAYARKKGTPAPAATVKTSAALEHMTLNQISSRITRWYEANPGRREMPVMGVIWVDMVDPGAAKR
jgi:hypothetical protein